MNRERRPFRSFVVPHRLLASALVGAGLGVVAVALWVRLAGDREQDIVDDEYPYISHDPYLDALLEQGHVFQWDTRSLSGLDAIREKMIDSFPDDLKH